MEYKTLSGVSKKVSLPKPYYTEPGITIYHGDARDIMPHLELVDMVVTDPPYGMNFQSNHRLEKHSKIIGDDSLPIDLIWDATMKTRNCAYFFCRWDNLSQMPPPQECFGLGQK